MGAFVQTPEFKVQGTESSLGLDKSNGRVPADKIIQIDLKGQSHNMGCYEIIKSIFYELNATDPYCLRVHYNV